MNKKQQDIAIRVAIIGAAATIIGAYLQGPLADTQWKDRPVVDVSLGNSHDYPSKELLKDTDGYYYIDILARNRGSSDGKFFVTVFADGASVNFDKNKNFGYSISLSYTVVQKQNYSKLYPPIYVNPNIDIDKFSVSVSAQEDSSQKPPFQQLNPTKPMKLVYKKSDVGYQLIEQE